MSSENKILTFLLVFSIIVSVGGTFLLINGILGFSNIVYTGASIYKTNAVSELTGVSVVTSSFGNMILVLILIVVIILTLLIMGLVNMKRRK